MLPLCRQKIGYSFSGISVLAKDFIFNRQGIVAMSDLVEKGVRILDAAADVEDLLRLAHEAVHRIHLEVSNEGFEHSRAMSGRLHQLREEARLFNLTLQKYVQEMESGFSAQGRS
jgi:hypothetical protein